MLLGVLSDTHDNISSATAGVTALRAAGAEFLIHCGDVGGQRILDLLAGVPSAFVWGNTDSDRASLRVYAADLGIQCCEEFGRLTLDGKKVAFTHGDKAALVREGSEGNFDYLFTGHTHVKSDQTVNRTRVINPGALHRASIKTVVILDLAKNTLRWLTL